MSLGRVTTVGLAPLTRVFEIYTIDFNNWSEEEAHALMEYPRAVRTCLALRLRKVIPFLSVDITSKVATLTVFPVPRAIGVISQEQVETGLRICAVQVNRRFGRRR